MINKKVIEELYKKYNKRPESPFDLNLSLLFDYLVENHNIAIDEENLTIGSIEEDSPFHAIPLRHIHAIVEFGDDIAVILHSSIIFLGKYSNKVHIHIKEDQRGFFARLFGKDE